MRITTKVVIDIDTGQVLSSEGFDYFGPIDQCLGGGAVAGGGGSSSGGSSVPEYIQSNHGLILMQQWINTASALETLPDFWSYDPMPWFGSPTGNSPYAVLTQLTDFDPELFISSITSMGVLSNADITVLKDKAAILRDKLTDPGYGQVVEDMIDAHADQLLARLDSDVISRIEIGMRDAGAVIGTSFVIAKELAMENYTREVAAFSTQARFRALELQTDLYKFIEDVWLKAYLALTDNAAKRTALYIEKYKVEATIKGEVANLAQTAQSKYALIKSEESLKKVLWKLELYHYLNQSLAAGMGAASTRHPYNAAATSVLTGTLGMAASGAGIGAYLASGTSFGSEMGMSGGPAGAIVGGVVGAGIGLLSGLIRK